MIKEIYLWYIRWFKIISTHQAIKLDLIWVDNLYGDSINKLNCRSIWKDKKERHYRIKEQL